MPPPQDRTQPCEAGPEEQEGGGFGDRGRARRNRARLGVDQTGGGLETRRRENLPRPGVPAVGGVEMYKQARERQAPGGPGNGKSAEPKAGGGPEGDVVDAEFEDVGKGKK